MKDKIVQFVADLNAKFPQISQFDKCYVMKAGAKYTKIMTADSPDSEGTSAYGFINNETGDVLKAASWAAPAKHSRGNINNSSGLDACGKYSVAYLR